MYTIYAAIKERALARHKSPDTQANVPLATSDSQAANDHDVYSGVQKSEVHSSAKKWRTVYSKYRGVEQRPQLIQKTTANMESTSSAHSTTSVTFPGFANLGIKKDKSSTKQEEGDTPVQPFLIDFAVKKEPVNRAGYLMPDEELLQKWTHPS